MPIESRLLDSVEVRSEHQAHQCCRLCGGLEHLRAGSEAKVPAELRVTEVLEEGYAKSLSDMHAKANAGDPVLSHADIELRVVGVLRSVRRDAGPLLLV